MDCIERIVSSSLLNKVRESYDDVPQPTHYLNTFRVVIGE